jgi:hypothetical protein
LKLASVTGHISSWNLIAGVPLSLAIRLTTAAMLPPTLLPATARRLPSTPICAPFCYIDLDPGLCADQYGAGIFRAQLFEGLATASSEGIEEVLGIAFHPRATSGKRAVDGKGEYGDRQTVFDVHVQPPGWAADWQRPDEWWVSRAASG